MGSECGRPDDRFVIGVVADHLGAAVPLLFLLLDYDFRIWALTVSSWHSSEFLVGSLFSSIVEVLHVFELIAGVELRVSRLAANLVDRLP